MLRQRCLPGAADGSSSRSGSHTWREELAELRGLYTAGTRRPHRGGGGVRAYAVQTAAPKRVWQRQPAAGTPIDHAAGVVGITPPAGHVFAWSICDSICGRLLGPLIKQLLKGPAPAEGQACARAVMGWCREEALWLRRSSVVAFVTLARLPDEQARRGPGRGWRSDSRRGSERGERGRVANATLRAAQCQACQRALLI